MEGEIDADRHRRSAPAPRAAASSRRRVVRMRRDVPDALEPSDVRRACDRRRTPGTRRGTCRTPSGTPPAAASTNGTDEAAGHTAPRISSFETKPAKQRNAGERQRADQEHDQRSAASSAPGRPSPACRCVPTAWMTAPAPRNSSALKTPCVSRWRKPGGGEARADGRHHVAELRDRRVREHALDVGLHAGEDRRHQRRDRADPGDDRAARPASARTATSSRVSRYTPAVTIVAA